MLPLKISMPSRSTWSQRVSEWLDLMMDEVERKKQELEEAKAESERRQQDGGPAPDDQPGAGDSDAEP